jgi:hypothetical protein
MDEAGLLEQFAGNFFGSDSQGGYPQSYIWMANQFGHVFIGFGGVFLGVWIASMIARRPAPSFSYAHRRLGGEPTLSSRTVLIIGLAWLALWLAKEWALDVALASERTAYWVTPYSRDLILDCLADSYFYLVGVGLALAHFGVLPLSPVPLLAGFFALAAAIAAYWLPERSRLETLNTPYFARLSSVQLGLVPRAFSTRLPSTEAMYARAERSEPLLQTLMETPLKPRHTVICGSRRDGLKHFGIALVTERTIRTSRNDAKFASFNNLIFSDLGYEVVQRWNGTSSRNPIQKWRKNLYGDVALAQASFIVLDEVASLDASRADARAAVPGRPRAVDAPEEDWPKLVLRHFFEELRERSVVWLMDCRYAPGWLAELRAVYGEEAVDFARTYNDRRKVAW